MLYLKNCEMTYLLAPKLTIFGQPSLSFSKLVHSVQ